jgi:hypothetical protein
MRVQDVDGSVKTYRVPFLYGSSREAGLAYDYATLFFCKLVSQRVKHKLNFLEKVVAFEKQAELRSFVEERVAQSYCFKVGKILPAQQIQRGIYFEEAEGLWKIRLCLQNGPHFLVIAPPLSFKSEQEAALSRD